MNSSVSQNNHDPIRYNNIINNITVFLKSLSNQLNNNIFQDLKENSFISSSTIINQMKSNNSRQDSKEKDAYGNNGDNFSLFSDNFTDHIKSECEDSKVKKYVADNENSDNGSDQNESNSKGKEFYDDDGNNNSFGSDNHVEQKNIAVGFCPLVERGIKLIDNGKWKIFASKNIIQVFTTSDGGSFYYLKLIEQENKECNKTYSLNGIIYIIIWKNSEKKIPKYEEIIGKGEYYLEKNYNLKFEGDFSFDMPKIEQINLIFPELALLKIKTKGKTICRDFIYGPNIDFDSYGESTIYITVKKGDKDGISLVTEQKSEDIEINYIDKSKYRGATINYKKNGRGCYYFKNGSWFEGQFENDKMNGEGAWYDQENRLIYRGKFKDGMIEE